MKSTGGPTFRDVLTEWLEYGRTIRGTKWAPRTADDTRKQVESRIVRHLVTTGSRTSPRHTLRNVYSGWTAEGLSDNTVHRYAALISSGPSFAVRRDYIELSPATRAIAPAPTKSTKKTPNAKEVHKPLSAADEHGHDLDAAIAIVVLTGAWG